jgi:hypothetical protein
MPSSCPPKTSAGGKTSINPAVCNILHLTEIIGLRGVAIQAKLTAIAVNLKRIAALEKGKGGGTGSFFSGFGTSPWLMTLTFHRLNYTKSRVGLHCKNSAIRLCAILAVNFL